MLKFKTSFLSLVLLIFLTLSDSGSIPYENSAPLYEKAASSQLMKPGALSETLSGSSEIRKMQIMTGIAILAVWAGIAACLVILNRRISRLEKRFYEGKK